MVKEFGHPRLSLSFLAWLDSLEKPKIIHTYSRHRRRSKTDFSRNDQELETCMGNHSAMLETRHEQNKNEISSFVTEKVSCKISDDIEIPRDDFAPITPDIESTKHRKQVEDVSGEACLTDPDSNKKTCRRSLSLDVNDFGSLPNELKDSESNEVSEEGIESQNGERSFLAWLDSLEKPKIIHTYSRHCRRSKADFPRKFSRNNQELETCMGNHSAMLETRHEQNKNEISGLVTEKVSCKISDDIEIPRDDFAPITPDIDSTKHRKRVEDVSREACLTDPDSNKKTCRRSLSLDVNDFGSLPNELKDSESNEVSEEGIESQNDEKEKLHRQIQSFLSHMQHFQGERKFSPWKGSVMDSIGGAYLAQNTDDTLSSAAFLSLAAKFPREALNVKGKEKHASSSKKVRRQKIMKSKQDPMLLNNLKDYQSKYYCEKKTLDALDWESVRKAKVSEVSKVIQIRGQNNNLAERIKNCLDDLVKNFGSTDMEWIRDVPYDIAKKYLMSIYGMGLKSVECIGLLTLGHKAFPIDRNAGRVALRLGWFPRVQLKEGEEFHLLKKYPKLNSIQVYLWQYLSDYDFSTLYELHCHVITFAKVFCTERNPKCYECPMREECKYFASKQDPTLKPTGLDLMDIEDNGTKKKIKKTLPSISIELQVYVLPDSHNLLVELETRVLDDPSPYLLAVWPPESEESTPEDDSVYGTILIPARTATRGYFPLNGTFFQSNEVFADDESSVTPIRIPRASLANLSTTTLYCGMSMASVCKDMKSGEVEKCFKTGFVCLRGFNMKTREPNRLSEIFRPRKTKSRARARK